MLNPEKNVAIPEMTQIVAKAAFPKGNIFITMRDELGPIGSTSLTTGFEDEAFDGQHAFAFHPPIFTDIFVAGIHHQPTFCTPSQRNSGILGKLGA